MNFYAVCFVLAWVGVVVGDVPTGPPDTTMEDLKVLDETSGFPDDFKDTHVVVIVMLGIGTFVLLVGLVVFVMFKKRITLSAFMLAGLWISVVGVGLMAWGVTYSASRTVMQEKTKKLLLTTSHLIPAVKAQLLMGTGLLELMNKHIETNVFPYNAPHPAATEYISGVLTTAGLSSETIFALYIGLQDGRFMGAMPFKNGTQGLFLGLRRGEPLPDYVLGCRPIDLTECGTYECVNQIEDRRCGKTCGHQSSAESCDVLSPLKDGTTTLAAFEGVSTSFVEVHRNKAGEFLNTQNVYITPFDATQRPWYTTEQTIQWSAPYRFMSEVGDIGFTASRAVYQAGVRRVVVSVDFTLGSITSVLASLAPTPNSFILLLTTEWEIASASLSVEEMRAMLPGYDTSVVNVTTLPDSSKVKVPLNIAQDSIISQKAAIDHKDGDVVLSFPISVDGLSLYAVVYLPSEDVMDDAADASTKALVIASVLSVLVSIFVFVCIHCALRPLTQLASDMEKIAWMKLEEVAEVSEKRLGPFEFYEVSWMERSFDKMVSNLREFKQFLPAGLVNSSDIELVYDQEFSSCPSQAALVFTDIRASAECWESSPEGMRKALKVHNQAIRRCIALHGGYEVKTIGDSFMIAFETSAQSSINTKTPGTEFTAAVQCALSIQEELLKADWPEELTSIDRFARTLDGAWGGLQVRVGVHHGSVDRETNNVSGRLDYFGATVNLASRLEGVCVVGCVAVVDDLLQRTDMQALGTPLCVPAGRVDIKGFEKAVNVSCLIPASLLGRKQYCEDELSLRRRKGNHHLTPDACDKKSDVSGGTTHRDGTRADRFKEHLHRIANTTVARFEFRLEGGVMNEKEDQHARVQDVLTKAFAAMQRTGGELIALVGQSVDFGWNTAKSCPNHSEQAFRFMRFAKRAMRAFSATEFLGICNGPLMRGTVGVSGQKFVTALGPTLTLASLLAQSAMDLDTFCLFSSFLGTRPDDHTPGLLREVDEWIVPEPYQKLSILEANHKLCVGDASPIVGPSAPPECSPGLPYSLPEVEIMVTDPPLSSVDEEFPSWGEAYSAAFHAQDFAKLDSAAIGDPVVTKVVEMLRSGSSLRKVLNMHILA